MNLARFLKEERVDLDLDALVTQRDAELAEAGEEVDEHAPLDFERVVEHMAELLLRSDQVGNARKLTQELVQCQRRTATLLGRGVAMPHVRTMQVRRLVMAVGVSRHGLPVDGTPDDEPLRLVVALVAPTYDDKTSLQVQRRIGEKLEEEGWLDEVLAAEEPGEVVRALAH